MIIRSMYTRFLESTITTALDDTPVVLLTGARQSGKTTLVRQVGEARGMAYVTFDDITPFAAATSDPEQFIRGFDRPVVIDEIQRVPSVLLAIKAAVDRHRAPGRFLLTGSTNVLHVPRVADSLAGRMEVHTLWPLSQGEIRGTREQFIDRAFSDTAFSTSAPARPLEELLRGGFPEVTQRMDDARRSAWFSAYVTTMLVRTVRDIAEIDGTVALPRLFAAVANRSSSLLNIADLARTVDLPLTTTRRYLALLELAYQVVRIPAWARNRDRRLAKAPKLVVTDSGLLAHLLAYTPARAHHDPRAAGALLESFVTMELIKQSAWSHIHPTLSHFRTQAGREVDLVLEDPHGRMVGIEVKMTTQVRGEDFLGLRALRDHVGKDFVRGVVLHRGAHAVAFGENLIALPLCALWS